MGRDAEGVVEVKQHQNSEQARYEAAAAPVRMGHAKADLDFARFLFHRIIEIGDELFSPRVLQTYSVPLAGPEAVQKHIRVSESPADLRKKANRFGKPLDLRFGLRWEEAKAQPFFAVPLQGRHYLSLALLCLYDRQIGLIELGA